MSHSVRIAVFRPDQEPWNMLEPVGTPSVYWSGFFGEFGRFGGLPSGTWTELTEVMERVERGRQPEEPYPSLKDFERLLFGMAERERRPRLRSAAHSLASLNAVLGRTALIRRAPEIEGRYDIIIHEYQGLPPRVFSFLAAVRLLRMQMRGMNP